MIREGFEDLMSRQDKLAERAMDRFEASYRRLLRLIDATATTASRGDAMVAKELGEAITSLLAGLAEHFAASGKRLAALEAAVAELQARAER
jgi:hypothetical protein